MPADITQLDLERAYVARAYDLLDRGLADTERSFTETLPSSRATAQALRRSLEVLRSSRGSGQLVFGRMDAADDTLYIGRRRVYDDEHNLVVLGWHAPAAQRFYEASPMDPCGLTLKRVFVEQDRVVRSIIDEVVDQAAAAASRPDVDGPTVSDALLEELERSRDGAMRDVVATIQAEQFAIIRSALTPAVVVQGGPGTGKTVVGLHRAAWLTFNHEDLRRSGLLVVAPSTAFLSYVGGVLPSLDVADVHQTDLGALYAGEAGVAGADDEDTARVKGSAQMAALLARALEQRTGWAGGDLELSLGRDRFVIDEQDVLSLLEDVRRRGLPHAEGRELVRNSLAALAFRRYSEHQREERRPTIANEATIRRLSMFTNALDRMWPGFTPEEFLRSLYGTQSWLTQAGDGLLAPDERARLFREQSGSVADEPWTADDLFCLDELAHLITGDVREYGHIVVDEAQDLSAMQARALARRCPTGSFTILGDLAQATGPWIRDSWQELTTHLGVPDAVVAALSWGYRVPGKVLELAASQLPLVSPGLTAPRSVRPGWSAPRARRVMLEDLLRESVATALEAVEAGMTVAVVVPDARLAEARAAVDAFGAVAGDGGAGEFDRALTLLPVGSCKGLEFDCVVLVAPDEIVGAAPDGRRWLYIAMTRCTQALEIVHAVDLPLGLESLAPPQELPSAARTSSVDASVAALEDEPPVTTEDRAAAVSAALRLLAPEDLTLVETLVERLLGAAPGTRKDDR